MILAQVVGTVVSTQKVDGIRDLKLLLLANLDSRMKPTESFVVAVDAVGAGAGEVVLYCTGSSARQTAVTDGRPADAVIMAIVDQVDLDGSLAYRKDAP
jgi:microcompartment protein CcmK/EutM